MNGLNLQFQWTHFVPIEKGVKLRTLTTFLQKLYYMRSRLRYAKLSLKWSNLLLKSNQLSNMK